MSDSRSPIGRRVRHRARPGGHVASHLPRTRSARASRAPLLPGPVVLLAATAQELRPNLVVHVGESAAGDVVGFAAAGHPRAPLEGYDTELFAIYVLTSNQGYGLGERLIRSVMSTVSRRGGMSLIAWVIATNPYRRFFEGLAGRPVAIEIVRADAVVRKVAYGWRRLIDIDRCERRDDWCSARRRV